VLVTKDTLAICLLKKQFMKIGIFTQEWDEPTSQHALCGCGARD
jgi:hypothetical protein